MYRLRGDYNQQMCRFVGEKLQDAMDKYKAMDKIALKFVTAQLRGRLITGVRIVDFFVDYSFAF